jgi:hypothetical protein
MVLVNGAMLLDESQRIGPAPTTESTTISPTSSGPPIMPQAAPPPPPPVATPTAPTADPQFDPIKTPADLGHAGAVCFSLQANPTDYEVTVVANRLVEMDGYTPEEAADIANYATSVICPDMRAVVLRAANDSKTQGPHPGG